MDGRRFDALMRALSNRGSRRRLLTRLLPGSGLAVLLGSDRLTPEAAAESDRQCRDLPAISNERCPQASCKEKGDQICCCARTVGGNRRFVDLADAECPVSDGCDSSEDCPGSQVCIQVGGCCERSRRNLCVRRCDVNATAVTASGSISAPLLGRP
jgi:hypothetical protein